MTVVNWNGNAALGGVVSGGGTVRKIDRQPKAKLAARGGVVGIGYSAAMLANLVATLETESDADVRRDVLARLTAYNAAAEADSVQDRSTVAHALQKQFEDADLLVRHLFGFFGPAGLIVDRPSGELLFELEGLVAAKRAAAGLPPLPGSVY
jgi:hypothetical protein